MSQPISLTNQWNDFLIRQHDPYAMAKYEILLEWMGNVRNKRCLVVGCGSGEFCAMLSLQGATVMAMDIDQKNIELAQETARKFNTSYETAVGRIETLDAHVKYDFVIATDVIEHIEDDLNAVKKLREVTATDGSVVITVPALNSLFGYHDEVLGHFRRYSKKSLRKLMNGQFEVKRMRYFGFFLIPVTLLISCLLRRPYPVATVGKSHQSKSFLGRILELFFKSEQKINLGLGTSLLMVGKPR